MAQGRTNNGHGLPAEEETEPTITLAAETSNEPRIVLPVAFDDLSAAGPTSAASPSQLSPLGLPVLHSGAPGSSSQTENGDYSEAAVGVGGETTSRYFLSRSTAAVLAAR